MQVDPIPEDENISSKTVDPDEAAQDNANSKASDINEENPPISSAKKRAGAEPNQEEQQAETDQEDSGSSQSESSGASSPTKTQQEQVSIFRSTLLSSLFLNPCTYLLHSSSGHFLETKAPSSSNPFVFELF